MDPPGSVGEASNEGLPSSWGLERRDGRLVMGGQDLTALASAHGTPLHVVSAATLRARCAELSAAFAGYPRPVQIRFSYKTNPVPGILRVIHAAGFGAEVVDGHEMWLAERLGVAPADVVFNGPFKTDDELRAAVRRGIGLVVVDGLAELGRIESAAAEAETRVPIALRVCPGVAPRGMNVSSLTGTRRAPFGFEIGSEELSRAIDAAVRSARLRPRGVMAHIGSGIHDVRAFSRCVGRLLEVQAQLARAGVAPALLDVGGGLGTRLSREFTTLEMLAYLGWGRLPRAPRPGPPDHFSRYARALVEAIEAGCARLKLPLPELVLEPGRAVASDAQLLLLRVGAVRERSGYGHLAITDGGALTVSMMFLSERHAVLLANRDAPPDGARTSVFGRLPSPMDLVYRNMRLPRLREGDLLAVMDAGAYFTSTATNFGGPRPAVALVEAGGARLVRRRETSEDLVRVDVDATAATGSGA